MSRRASAIKSPVLNSLSKLQPDGDGQSIADTLPHSQENPDSPLTLVCAACRTGPFSYEGFRQAVLNFHLADTGYCYTTTWHDISQSIINEDCNWCGLICQTRDRLPAEKFPRAGEENVEIRVQVKVLSPLDWIDVTNTITVFLNGYKAATYKIYADPSDAAAKEIGTGNHIRREKPYVDYDKAKQCVKNCSDHDRCSKLDETYLPTRVIDCSDPSKPRLFETHRQIKGYYCTLSYVWGGEQHQKTTAANIDTYVREGINVPLPQTIADAIFVTHKLGVRYLWVDALCIIQDSFEDKVKELANMGRIYRDSSLTISVLSAYRADEGFLPDERTSVVLPFHVAHLIARSRSLGRMLLKYDIPRQDPSLGYKHQTVATHSPLDERGWCLQESILSPRRLIFQPPYVQYKCRSFSQNFTPDRWEKETASGYSQSDYILFTIAKDTSASGGGVADDKLRERWEQILSSYTRCKITVPNDKLVALAGVAEVFQSISQDDYLAGLWRRTLLNDLLWKPFGPIGPDEVLPPRPVEYRAPTWSWASVGDVVINPHRKHMFEDPSTEYEAEILACEVTPKSSIHPLGEVEEATLTVEAKIRPLMLDGQKCTFMERKGTRTGDVFQSVSLGGDWVAPVGNCLESGSSSVDRLGGEGQEKKRIGIRFDCLEGTAQDRPMDFFVIILRAGRRWGNREGYRDEGWMRGLLVLRVEDDVEQYRRVAKLDLQYNFQWPDWFDTTPLKTVTLV